MVPNKTIYVSDDDMPLYRKAQELAGGNLSAAISAALRRYVELLEGRAAGYEEIVVRVGPGKGRKQRFTGVLLGEWGRSTAQRVETIRVYGTPSRRFVVHTERSKSYTAGGPEAEKWNTGWRAWVGNWSANQSWGIIPADSKLQVANSLEELREMLPQELYDIVADIADQPPIEDLDI